MAERILGEYPAELRKMHAFIEEYADLKETPAQFQERCGQIALACFWRKKGHAPDEPAETRPAHRFASLNLNDLPEVPLDPRDDLRTLERAESVR